MSAAATSGLVKRRARDLGFDAVGITDLSPPPHADELTEWLESGMAGTMGYMHRQAARRIDPARIAPGATRAVVVTSNYFQKDPDSRIGTGLVAKYARGRDYHAALRSPLDALASFMTSLGPPGTFAKAYIDAGPVPERELAQRAGIGWIGKNTLLIDPRRGSFFFLATVLTNLEMAIDLPFEADRCGTCTRCLDACPTAALPQPRVLDSRRCISYLTIEHRGEIAEELAGSMGTHVFGCDICQDVCPWNLSFAQERQEPGSEPGLALVNLEELSNISDQAFNDLYSTTPLARPGPTGMRRNARIARANEAVENACRTP